MNVENFHFLDEYRILEISLIILVILTIFLLLRLSFYVKIFKMELLNNLLLLKSFEMVLLYVDLSNFIYIMNKNTSVEDKLNSIIINRIKSYSGNTDDNVYDILRNFKYFYIIKYIDKSIIYKNLNFLTECIDNKKPFKCLLTFDNKHYTIIGPDFKDIDEYKSVPFYIMDITEEKMKDIDSLTGVLTRKGFYQLYIDKNRNKANNYLLFIDLDKFKDINDKHGHEYGDEVLRIVGRRLASNIKNGDIICRYGGDEFCIYVKDGYETLSERILKIISEPIYVNGNVFNLSCSIGISEYGKDGNTLQELIKVADKKMYTAKKMGGNSFVV